MYFLNLGSRSVEIYNFALDSMRLWQACIEIFIHALHHLSPRLQNVFRHVCIGNLIKSHLYGNSLLPCSVNIRDGTHFKFAPHQLPQSVWESIAWTHLRAAKMHSTPDQNMKWQCVQRLFTVPVLNFCSTSLYFCQVHLTKCNWFPNRLWQLVRSKLEMSTITYVHTPRKKTITIGEDHIRFLFC